MIKTIIKRRILYYCVVNATVRRILTEVIGRKFLKDKLLYGIKKIGM